MKKHLLIYSLMLAASSTLHAQDTTHKPGTVQNPIILEIGGDNTYEFTGSYSTPVYKYTAPDDQLVSVTPNTSQTSIKVTSDGQAYGSRQLPSVKYSGDYLFIVAKDATVYLNVTTYSSPISLSASARSHPYNLGITAVEAIEITADGAPMFVPFREESYKEVPVYLKYSASDDGALEMTFSGYVHEAYYAEGVNGEFSGITCKRSGDNYRTFIPVYKGKEYIVRISSTSAKMLTSELTHPVYGESEDYPFVLTGTEAEIPAKGGKYYYEVTGTESGYGVVSSDITDFDGTVSWGKQVESGLMTVSDGSFDIRQTATKGGHYFIVVDKKSDTPSPQKFNVRFETAQPYDSFYNGAEIASGAEVKLPPYPGTYYYRIKTPSEGAYILKAAPGNPFTGDKSDLRLFKPESSSTPLYIGEPDIYCEVEASKEYIIQVTTVENDKRNTLNVSLLNLQQGDGASNPFDVNIGNNNLPDGDAKYYLYKATKSSWVIVTPADMSINAPTVKRIKSELSTSEQNVTILRHGDAYRFEAETGHSYLLRFTKVKAATSFDFSTPDYAQGESRDNPFKAEGSSISIPETPGVYWWSYKPERNGKLHISTDFKYDVVSSPTRENSVKLYSDESGNVLASLAADLTAETFNQATYNVDEGKKYLIQVSSVSEQVGKTVTLEITDLDPGETPAVAIPITSSSVPFEYSMEANPKGFTSARWYSIDLKEGDLSIYSKSSVSFYFYQEREDNNYTTSTYKFYASSFWDTSYTNRYYGMSGKAIPEPGRYLIAAYFMYSDISLTFEGSALKATTSGIEENVESTQKAYHIESNTIYANKSLSIYDLSGRLVTCVAAGECAVVPAGIYIVRSGDTVTKLLIK
ncbi:hypothetical protein [uncultured Muribaculum sp.]|uniref:hypothetical protein n=1 Tax=uncultured Muribaculum sp. TaxID=1918613 RepID=UPI0025E0E1B9|nr:hypothetical protein [uncultured Muribaculum sp.]